MIDSRGELEVETLLKIVLGWWLYCSSSRFRGGDRQYRGLLGPFFILVQLGIAVLIVLWLLDQI